MLPRWGMGIEARLRRDLRAGETEVSMPLAWVRANDWNFVNHGEMKYLWKVAEEYGCTVYTNQIDFKGRPLVTFLQIF